MVDIWEIENPFMILNFIFFWAFLTAQICCVFVYQEMSEKFAHILNNGFDQF
jgi:hypothetical protein